MFRHHGLALEFYAGLAKGVHVMRCGLPLGPLRQFVQNAVEDRILIDFSVGIAIHLRTNAAQQILEFVLMLKPKLASVTLQVADRCEPFAGLLE
ncbi:hypothetical protein D3C71_1422050 [compost metagenome]